MEAKSALELAMVVAKVLFAHEMSAAKQAQKVDASEIAVSSKATSDNIHRQAMTRTRLGALCVCALEQEEEDHKATRDEMRETQIFVAAESDDISEKDELAKKKEQKRLINMLSVVTVSRARPRLLVRDL